MTRRTEVTEPRVEARKARRRRVEQPRLVTSEATGLIVPEVAVEAREAREEPPRNQQVETPETAQLVTSRDQRFTTGAAVLERETPLTVPLVLRGVPLSRFRVKTERVRGVAAVGLQTTPIKAAKAS